jgi:hypothetical protein
MGHSIVWLAAGPLLLHSRPESPVEAFQFDPATASLCTVAGFPGTASFRYAREKGA